MTSSTPATARRTGRPRKAPEDPSTRDVILQKATDLFSRNGYTGVSIRDITRAVGIKESSLYNHFQHKEALLDAVLDEMEKEFSARDLAEVTIRAQIKEMSPETFMRASFQRFMEFWHDPRRVRLWFVVSMEQYRNERAGRLVLEETRQVTDLVEYAFAAMRKLKKIRPLDTRMLAEIYAGTLRGMQMEYGILLSNGKDTREVKRRMEAFISFFAALITD